MDITTVQLILCILQKYKNYSMHIATDNNDPTNIIYRQ